jgi:hypothetical protein
MNKKVFLIALAGSLGWLGIAGADFTRRGEVEVRTNTNAGSTDKPAADKPADTSNSNANNTDKPAADKPADTSNSNANNTDKPAADKPADTSNINANTNTGGSTTGENTGGSGSSSSGTTNTNTGGSGSAPAPNPTPTPSGYTLGYGPGQICPTGGGGDNSPVVFGTYNSYTGTDDPSPLIRCPCGWRRAPYANYCINEFNTNEKCCPVAGCQITSTPCSQIDPNL